MKTFFTILFCLFITNFSLACEPAYWYNPYTYGTYTNNVANNYMQWRKMNAIPRTRVQPPKRQYTHDLIRGYQRDMIPFGRYEQHLQHTMMQLEYLRDLRIGKVCRHTQ